ncbi:DnaJ C-terminal domain-containing protein [soil metagenome]
MEFKDYYQILGIGRDATQDDIKRAYRKLARKYHPDVSKASDAEARFKEVGEAYEVLKDAEKRAAYDQFGSRWKQGQDFRPPPDWDAGFEFSGDTAGSGFSDFFETLFGRARAGGARTGANFGTGGLRMRGEDHHARILIDLEDSYRGATRSVTLRAPAVENGRVTTRERTLNVKVPRGITPGQRIRLPGQGASGVGGGETGDLYLEADFRPHALFRPEKRDVYLELPVTPWEAALGATVTVPTLGGNVDLKIPAGSQSGRRLRLKGRGLPGRVPGDQYVILSIMTPPADSEAARAIYRQMAEEMPMNPRTGLGIS